MSPVGPQVLELQDCVSRLQTLNNELQNQLSLVEKSGYAAYDKEDGDVASRAPWKKVRSYKRRLQVEVVLEVETSKLFPGLYNKGQLIFVQFVHIFQILEESFLGHCLTSTFY